MSVHETREYNLADLKSVDGVIQDVQGVVTAIDGLKAIVEHVEYNFRFGERASLSLHLLLDKVPSNPDQIERLKDFINALVTGEVKLKVEKPE